MAKQPTELTEEQKRKAEFNQILTHLAAKQFAEWTPEENIEKHFSHPTTGIHYYHVRQALEYLRDSGYLDYSRNQSQYKINNAGRAFITDGGFK